MSIGLLLLIIALILAIVAAFQATYSTRLLAASVVLVCIAVLLGVAPLSVT